MFYETLAFFIRQNLTFFSYPHFINNPCDFAHCRIDL
jgi:hypothetical protein